MSHHGMSALNLVTLAGATCADGDKMVHRDRRDVGPAMAAYTIEQRWGEEFDKLLAAWHDATQGEQPLARMSAFLQREIIPRLTGSGDAVRRERWEQLFGWAGVPWAEIRPIAPNLLLSILCCLFCKAEALRWNHFGRILPAAATAPAETALAALAGKMNEGFGVPTGDIPLGFVFLAQFIDHDITLDATSALSDDAFTVEDILNLRTPAFDLDCVYGDGPEGSPYLYDQLRRTFGNGVGYLLVADGCHDLPRNPQGRALIGDPRNDENLFVSQLHLQFLLFHNAVLRLIETGGVDGTFGRSSEETGHDFEFARRLVRWHYQWLMVNEFLPMLIEPTALQAAHAITGVPQGTGGVPPLPPGYEAARERLRRVDRVDCCGRRKKGPLIPVEFSGAAFRFAHSQVPSRLDINANRRDVPIFTPRPAAPGAFTPALDAVEWSRFFALDGSSPQRARPIDTSIAAQLYTLPFITDGTPSLPLRNLIRSTRTYRVPTGEAAAAALGISTTMSSPSLAKAADAGLAGNTPLWFYCLGEAENFGGKLGRLGGLIVAWTLLRILECDPRAYVNAPGGWQPVLNASTPGQFGVADLIRIAQGERQDACPT